MSFLESFPGEKLEGLQVAILVCEAPSLQPERHRLIIKWTLC